MRWRFACSRWLRFMMRTINRPANPCQRETNSRERFMLELRQKTKGAQPPSTCIFNAVEPHLELIHQLICVCAAAARAERRNRTVPA